jgi:two-component system LytT family sensor kinase
MPEGIPFSDRRPVQAEKLEPSIGPTLRVASVVWSVVAWLAVLDLVATAFVNRTALPSWRALVPSLAEWYLWVPLSPLVVWLGRRFPVARPRSWVDYLPHAAGIIAASALRGVVYFSTAVGVEGVRLTGSGPANLWRMILGFMPIAAILYCGILVVDMAARYAQRSRAGELRAAQLETQLARAELRALQANLHPHFLFNALHSVSALVRIQEPDTAVNVIAELSELLRYLLQRDAPDEVPLTEELAFVRRYLAIEQVRFSDRLQVVWDIDTEVECAAVPRLLLQPLVENALRHGVARSSAAGEISVHAHREGSWLALTVRDDGPGPNPLTANGNTSSGWGLDSTRVRLARAYGTGAGVSLERSTEGETIAAARLPFRPLTSRSRGGRGL